MSYVSVSVIETSGVSYGECECDRDQLRECECDRDQWRELR